MTEEYDIVGELMKVWCLPPLIDYRFPMHLDNGDYIWRCVLKGFRRYQNKKLYPTPRPMSWFYWGAVRAAAGYTDIQIENEFTDMLKLWSTGNRPKMRVN